MSACASGPTYRETKSSLKPQSGKGLAIIYYQGGFVGAAAKMPLYISDNVVTEKFQRASFVTCQANSGPVRIGLSLSPEHNTMTASKGAGNGAASGALGGAVYGLAVGGPIGAIAGAAGGAVGGAIGGAIGGSNAKKPKDDFVIINMKPGQTQFVEVIMGHPQMRQVTREEAEPGIAECHWLNPTEPPRN